MVACRLFVLAFAEGTFLSRCTRVLRWVLHGLSGFPRSFRVGRADSHLCFLGPAASWQTREVGFFCTIWAAYPAVWGIAALKTRKHLKSWVHHCNSFHQLGFGSRMMADSLIVTFDFIFFCFAAVPNHFQDISFILFSTISSTAFNTAS